MFLKITSESENELLSMRFKGKCAIKHVHGLPKLEPSHKVSSKVIKSFMVQPQLVKIGGPWTWSMIRGSMDPVHILMDPVHGPGPRRGSMDQGSMFCTFPLQATIKVTREGHVMSTVSGG